MSPAIPTGCSASSRSSPASCTIGCAAMPSFELQFDSAVREVQPETASASTVAIERRGRRETRHGRWLIGADGARSDVRRSLGIELRGLHLAGTLSGGEHAVRFPHRHPRPGRGDLRRRSRALALPAADSRAVAGDVSDRRATKATSSRSPRLRAVAHGHDRARHLATTRSRTSRSTRCISGWRRRSSSGACSSPATPPTSTIRSAAWG